MASQTNIINMALTKLGEKTVSSIDQDTPTATKLKTVYDQILDEALLDGPEKGWKFANVRVSIEVDATSPDSEFDYRYAIPNDCLRITRVHIDGDDLTDWEREGQYIVTNQEADSIDLNYINRETNTGKMPAYFIRYFYLAIANHLAYSLTQVKGHANAVYEEMLIAKRRAMADDGQEGYVQDFSSSWVEIGNDTSTLE